MVIDLTRKTLASNVISQPLGADLELSTIAKIHKYKGLQEGHHFILMAMEVHSTLGHDIDHFIKECARLFHIDNQEVVYPCLFAFNFLSNVLVLLSNML